MKWVRIVSVARCVALSAFAVSPAWASPWSVACDAELYCIARLAVPQAADPDARLKIERPAAENARVFITLGATPAFEPGMMVAIETLGTGFRHEGPVEKVYGGNEMTFAEPARGPIVEALRGAVKAQFSVRFGGGTGTLVYGADLNGLTAALLEIDRAQSRIGRPDAMVAWGAQTVGTPTGAAASASPPAEAPPPEPQQAAAAAAPPADDPAPVGSGEIIYDRSGLPPAVAAVSDAYGCTLEDALPAWGAKALGMGGGRTMYVVPCHNADINVESHVMLMGPDGSVTAFQFERPPGENAPLRPTLVNPDYDVASGILRATVYNSPEGDCGEFERHRLLEDASAFELIEILAKEACDGNPGVPEQWPLSWTIDEMGG